MEINKEQHSRSKVENIKKINESLYNLKIATEKRIIATATRMWVEDTPQIHALNYWYYRWFTNDFELYILMRLNNE